MLLFTKLAYFWHKTLTMIMVMIKFAVSLYGNNRYSFTYRRVLLSVEIYTTFLLKQIFSGRNRLHKSTVIGFSSDKAVFLPNLLFGIVWKVNIFIIRKIFSSSYVWFPFEVLLLLKILKRCGILSFGTIFCSTSPRDSKKKKKDDTL